MPSGKRAKQQRRQAATATRTPPPVRSKGMPRGARQASPRALAIGGGVVALVAIAVVLAVVFSGGSKAPVSSSRTIGSDKWVGALAGAPQANDLFKGIPESGLTLGKLTAPVQMVMFIDVQCPICQGYEINYLPTIVQRYIRTGKVRLFLKPWAFISSQSFTGRLAVIAASFQNKAFQYAKVLYDNQGQERSGWLTDTMMQNIGLSVSGLNVRKLFADKASSRSKRIAQQVDSLAQAWHVQGTPTIFVARVGKRPHDITPPTIAPNLQQTEQALDAALAGA